MVGNQLHSIVKKELTDVWHHPKSRLILIIMIIIPIVDLCMVFWPWARELIFYANAYEDLELFIEQMPHPSRGALLSGASHGHIPQMLLMWLLPFYVLSIYADSYVNEHKLGYDILLATRKKKADIFTGKLVSGFITGFIAFFISLSINYLLCLILFHKGKSFSGLETYAKEIPLLDLSISHPILTYIVYIIFSSIIAGLCSMMCVAFSYLFKNHKLLYGISIIVWFVQISYKYSIVYVMQPFTEYGVKIITTSFCIFLGIVFVSIVAGFFSGPRRDML